MHRIERISLTHFKNYETAQFTFDRVTGICGKNGMGKTNLLDAIYYCCFTRSYFSTGDQPATGKGKEGFRLQGFFKSNGNSHEVLCIYRGLQKKEILLDGVAYDKFSRHIGLLPVVMVAPDDAELITGGSESRRKFIDALMCQSDPEYLEQLIRYNKLLRQRNSLLRQEPVRHDVLDVLDEQMTVPCEIIFKKRETFLRKFFPYALDAYHAIAGDSEKISMEYETTLRDAEFREMLAAARPKDMMLQRSTCGIHRDELSFMMNGQPFRQIASQGQRKSLLFALKLAEFEMLREIKGFPPILLLDDVFEKLDDSRMQNLLSKVCTGTEGQVIITDTHRSRIEDAMARLGVEGSIIELK